VCDRDEEERVAVVQDTSKSVVPSEESSCKTKGTACGDARLVWGGRVVLQVTNAEEEEGEIKGEEQEEEGDCGTEGGEKEEGGEDEPTLEGRS
jgi:hypothetical protein